MTGPALVAAGPSAALAGAGDRLLLVVALLAVAALVWWLVDRRTGTFRTVAAAAPQPRTTVRATDLGAPLGDRATFVQFSAATCATCPHVHRVLTALADREDGVVHVEVDAEATMDLVRRFGVLRTPTVLLVDADGVVRSRTSGPITAAQAATALAELDQPARPDLAAGPSGSLDTRSIDA